MENYTHTHTVAESLPMIRASTVIQAKDNDPQLLELARILGLPTPNKDKILRLLTSAGKLNNDFNVYDLLSDDALEKVLMELDSKSIFSTCDSNSRLSEYCNSGLGLYTIRRRLRETTGFDTSNFTFQRLRSLFNIHRHDKSLVLASKYISDKISLVIKNGLVYPLKAKTGVVGKPLPIPGKCVKASKDAIDLILTESGIVYTNGEVAYNNFGNRNFYFKRGVYGSIDKSEFGNKRIVDVKCDNLSCYFLTEDGYVYGFGNNRGGQLGFDSRRYPELTRPKLIPGLKNIVGFGHAHEDQYFIDRNGLMYKCGLSNETIEPSLVPDVKDVVFMDDDSGSTNGIILDGDGNLYSVTKDILQRRIAKTSVASDIARVSEYRSLGLYLTFDGDVYLSGKYEDIKVELKELTQASNIVCCTIYDNYILIKNRDEDVYLLVLNKSSGIPVVDGLYLTVTKLEFP